MTELGRQCERTSQGTVQVQEAEGEVGVSAVWDAMASAPPLPRPRPLPRPPPPRPLPPRPRGLVSLLPGEVGEAGLLATATGSDAPEADATGVSAGAAGPSGALGVDEAGLEILMSPAGGGTGFVLDPGGAVFLPESHSRL